jgi:bisphosphoglycerate-dependent phosphoglycerate mutase
MCLFTRRTVLCYDNRRQNMCLKVKNQFHCVYNSDKPQQPTHAYLKSHYLSRVESVLRPTCYQPQQQTFAPLCNNIRIQTISLKRVCVCVCPFFKKEVILEPTERTNVCIVIY